MTFPQPLRYVKPPAEETWTFLTEIEWFSNCGIDSDLPKEKAMGAIVSPDWENFTLERRNDITGHLATAHRNRESEWNKVAKGVRGFTEDEVFPRMRDAWAGLEFPEAARHQVEWDVSSYIQEEIYASWRVPRFFDQLIEIYRAGHLPCGWLGSYPDGELQIH
jgi:hypothetical protein